MDEQVPHWLVDFADEARTVWRISYGGKFIRLVTDADMLDWLEKKVKEYGISNMDWTGEGYNFRIEVGFDGLEGEHWGEGLRDAVISGIIDDLIKEERMKSESG